MTQSHIDQDCSRSPRKKIERALWGLGVMALIGAAVWVFKPTIDDGLDIEESEPSVTLEEPPVPLPPAVSHDYVGSQACAKCHAKIMQSYAGHPMAKSMATVQMASPIENREQTQFTTTKALSYYVERLDDQVIHHEVCKDAQGEKIYDQGVPVHYAVGSGVRGRTYLTNDSGRLLESMISWFAESNSWQLSPGYHPEVNERFERRCSDGCLACHAGRLNPHETDLNRFKEQPFLEVAIGCERCHGPASEHVAFHEKGPHAAGEIDPIVNPSDFTDGRRDAVCGQCHLQGRRRVVRFGRSEFDFRPGMYLNENWTVFLKTAGVQSGQAAAVSQVEQMHASQCFLKSGTKLSCTSCHNPHSVPTPEEKVGFYREQCLKCHSPGQPECSEKLEVRQQADAADSCIKCHMPAFPAADVHAAQTDHRVLRRPIAPQSRKQDEIPMGAPIANSTLMFEEAGFTPDAFERDRARGIRLAELAEVQQDKRQAKEAIDLLIPWARRAKNDEEGLYTLGNAFRVIEQKEFAIQSWKLVLNHRPTHEDALEALAVEYQQAGDLTQAREYYERLLKVNPTHSKYHGRFAHVLGQLGDFEAGIQSANRALELNPSLVQAHAWLAEVSFKQGNKSLAEKHAAIVEQFYSTRPKESR